MTKYATRSRFVLLALLLALAVNFPMLSAANKKVFIGGIPLLYVYIGGIWLAVILFLFLTVKSRSGRHE